MANPSRALCRKCLGFVSRIGSLAPQPPASTTGRGGGYPIPENSAKHHSVATAAVIVASLAALIGMMVIAVLIRRKRIREQLLNGNAPGAIEGALEAKGGNEDAAQGDNGKWSADAVELVVMAGETSPTFVAHPVPASSVVQCPPFTLPKDPQ